MEDTSTPSPHTSISRPGLPTALRIVGVVLAAIAIVVTLGQVEVEDPTTETTRSCGSAFDSMADRSGWEVWWSADLDDPNDVVRSTLLRTTECPDAVNRRMVVAAGLGTAAVVLGVVAARLVRPRRQPASDDVVARLARLGRTTSVIGAGLTLGGIVAVILLVADADSTLFLYTDRLVVGVVGLIVLVPTVALFVLGRTLVLVARANLQSSAHVSPPVPDEMGSRDRGEELDDA